MNTGKKHYKEYLKLERELDKISDFYKKIVGEKPRSTWRSPKFLDLNNPKVEILPETFTDFEYTEKTKKSKYFEEVRELLERSKDHYTNEFRTSFDWYIRDKSVHVRFPSEHPYYREGTIVNLRGITITDATEDKPYLLRKQNSKQVNDGKESYVVSEPKILFYGHYDRYKKGSIPIYKPTIYATNEDGHIIYHDVIKWRDKLKTVYYDYWVLNIDFFIRVITKHYQSVRYDVFTDLQSKYDEIYKKQNHLAEYGGLYTHYWSHNHKEDHRRKARRIHQQRLNSAVIHGNFDNLSNNYYKPHCDVWDFD